MFVRVQLAILLILCILNLHCGNTKGLALDDGEDEGTGSTESGSDDTSDGGSDDPAEDVQTETISTETSGDNTKTPVPDESTNDNITLNCTDRDAGDSSDADFITVTCGEGDGADVAVYYCDSETVVQEGGSETDTELFTITDIECTVEDDGSGTIVEGETEVG